VFYTISRSLKSVLVFCIAVVLAGCVSPTTPQPVPTTMSQPTPTQTSPGQIANPASENCVKQGGTLTIQKRGDGSEYGVCVLEDNRQCEEWAMLREECPVDGIKITGYTTLAAQYCAITGGTYQITGSSNADEEQGTCTFKNGQTCDAWDYYNGKCGPNTAEEQSLYSDPLAYCAAVGTIDTPDERYTGPKMPDSIVQGMIKQEIVSADAPLEFQQNAVWRCMNNSVWVCHFGANLPCLEKADMSQAPTPAMEDFCKTNSTAENIPAAVTGRATVYEWRCKNGEPEVVRQLFTVDPQGYLADFWYELTPE
jgi:putative hemolysin